MVRSVEEREEGRRSWRSKRWRKQDEDGGVRSGRSDSARQPLIGRMIPRTRFPAGVSVSVSAVCHTNLLYASHHSSLIPLAFVARPAFLCFRSHGACSVSSPFTLRRVLWPSPEPVIASPRAFRSHQASNLSTSWQTTIQSTWQIPICRAVTSQEP